MHKETILLHHGYKPNNEQGVAVPINQTVAYGFDTAQHCANLFGLKESGNIYTRLMNPTTGVLEERINALEGGAAALAYASGMAAITGAIQTFVSSGDNILVAKEIYGGTYNLFANVLTQFGIESKFFSLYDLDAGKALIDANTKAVFCESISNPGGRVADLQAVAALAKEANLPLIVDNTVATPLLCNPIAHGANIVVHSATKYIGGHGTTIGGIVVDAGTFDWAKEPEKFPVFNTPDASYNGLVFARDLGNLAFILRARVVQIRNMGASIAPIAAWNLLQGLETLHLRIERTCENATKIAKYLSEHPQVEFVRYAGLETDQDYKLAQKYTSGKASGILSFEIKGGKAAAEKFYNALNIFIRLVNIGDAKSCATIPAFSTHSQLNSEELKAAGISEGLIRLTLGIENIEDLKTDLEQAFIKAK